jgi:hypothetical protein
MALLMWMPFLTRGRVCSFQLLLGIASAVFLGLSPAGLMNINFLFLTEVWVVVRETTLGVRSRKQYLRFKRFSGSPR